MSPKTPVLTDKAPKPLPGIYSQAIIANGVVYCSGAVAMDPTTGKLVDGDVKAHTVCMVCPPENRDLTTRQHQCIKNLTHILEEAGTDITKVVKVNVFLSNMDDFSEMNSVYMQYWGDVKPCRTCVAVKTLPLNTDVEIECIAVL
ncbi:YjgF/Yer057p/UK114 family [Penicillium lagena]|uniref:YjgF/Yer057p/UK114 family n=1 Tax=Penicillium lagena TaxID=94218 RepID=UPI00253FB79C|nr:YjgF/Yer057p/UK114 family [Penicillium lagena]KAJ5623823.1 YjgF/Yer057p/UK114 family [Penicillium lagena]